MWLEIVYFGGLAELFEAIFEDIGKVSSSNLEIKKNLLAFIALCNIKLYKVLPFFWTFFTQCFGNCGVVKWRTVDLGSKLSLWCLIVYPISFGQHIIVIIRPVTQLGPDLTCENTRALVFAKVACGVVSLMLVVFPVHRCCTPVFLLSRWQCSLWQTKFYCCDLEAVDLDSGKREHGRHLPWPPSLGGNFLSHLQTWQKAADWGSENALIVARL